MKAYSTLFSGGMDPATFEKIRAISPNFICIFFSSQKVNGPIPVSYTHLTLPTSDLV